MKLSFQLKFTECFILFNLITPWSRVLLENLTGSQPIKKFPAFYGTTRFIIVFTRATQRIRPSLSQLYSFRNTTNF
jgi:hypothetical protein